MVTHLLRRVILFAVAFFILLWWFRFLPQQDSFQFQHRYNAYSCPGFVTSSISLNTTAIAPPRSQNADHPVPPDFSVSPFAYVFYATQDNYACSVLVNVYRLNNVFNTSHRIIVLVKPDLPSLYLTALTAQNATVIPYEPPPLADSNVPYYQDVLLKLVGFRLHHYIPSLKRVLILDSDQLILQSLDHVFGLPEVDIAAPRAYWQSEGFTSAFILVSLSDRLWDKVSNSLFNIDHDVFDMDLVNKLFGKTLLVLPGDYATLNSHWETNDIPSWWQGDEPMQTFFPRPPKPAPLYVVTNGTNHTLTRSDREKLARTSKENFERAKLKERRERLEDVLYQVVKDVKVLHFTAVGKPWSYPASGIESIRPNAHPLLAEHFRSWRNAAREICPYWDGEPE